MAIKTTMMMMGTTMTMTMVIDIATIMTMDIMMMIDTKSMMTKIDLMMTMGTNL